MSDQKKSEIRESANDKSVEFLYSTKAGKIILQLMLLLHAPKSLGFFLRSPLSKFYISKFVRKNHIDMTGFENADFKSFNDFFTRKKEINFDSEPSHLISPADSLLSVYDISEDSKFHIKGFDYSLSDFFGLKEKRTPENKKNEIKSLISKFQGGKCLVFRLCATDYHRYCYIDDGFQAENNFISGSLYSVQPAACENFRVYTKNRRSWTILKTNNFSDVAQIEIGAFSVGGIKNTHESYIFTKGEEKGYFDLHGSTIVLLIQKNKFSLLPEIEEFLKENTEYRVKIGQQIGSKTESK